MCFFYIHDYLWKWHWEITGINIEIIRVNKLLTEMRLISNSIECQEVEKATTRCCTFPVGRLPVVVAAVAAKVLSGDFAQLAMVFQSPTVQKAQQGVLRIALSQDLTPQSLDLPLDEEETLELAVRPLERQLLFQLRRPLRFCCCLPCFPLLDLQLLWPSGNQWSLQTNFWAIWIHDSLIVFKQCWKMRALEKYSSRYQDSTFLTH